MKVWTKQYRPFVMGGDVRRNIRCDLPAEGPHDLGQDYLGYIVTSPGGRTFVAEKNSGAIIGDTLEAVRQDIREGDPALMARQVEEATKARDEAVTVEPEEFWSCLPR